MKGLSCLTLNFLGFDFDLWTLEVTFSSQKTFAVWKPTHDLQSGLELGKKKCQYGNNNHSSPSQEKNYNIIPASESPDMAHRFIPSHFEPCLQSNFYWHFLSRTVFEIFDFKFPRFDLERSSGVKFFILF